MSVGDWAERGVSQVVVVASFSDFFVAAFRGVVGDEACPHRISGTWDP